MPTPRALVARQRDPRVVEARKLLDRGLYPRAWPLLEEAAESDDPDPEALAAFWNLAVLLRRESEALPAARELLRQRLRDGDFEGAAELLEQLATPLASDPDLPALELRAAEGLAGRQPEAAARLLAASEAHGELTPGLRARAARLRDRLAGGPSSPTAPATAAR